MAIKFIDLIQGSSEWKDFRKFKIGSSMASSILGIGFRTPLQLFEDIMEDREVEVNDAMKRGNEAEPLARKWINDKYGSDLRPAVIQHQIYDWHISSLDGICKKEDGTYFVCEIKHPGKIDHDLALQGIVPEKYIPQCLHILEDLPGVDKILYCSYRNENDVAEIWVYRDKDRMEKQIKIEKDFFYRLINCDPPDPIGKDWVTISNFEAISWADEYQIITSNIMSLQERSNQLKKNIIDKVSSHRRSLIGNMRVQNVIRKGQIDIDSLRKKYNISDQEADEFRKASTSSWRFN